MKCLAHKRHSSIERLRQKFARNMPPTSHVTEQEPEEDRPLIPPQITAKEWTIHGPDGVWSWVVALANFFVNFVIVGLGRMSGVLYVDFMNIFHIGRESASMPFSVQQAARNLFGPLAGLLGQKYGVRAVTIVGGIIGSISAVACFFITDMLWITIMWGLFFGISTAFTTTLNQVSIDQHFERHRATAGGLAFSGGCVGAFFFPAVIEVLMSHYSIPGTFLVLGAIILNVVPAALLLTEPKSVEAERRGSRHRKSKQSTSYGSLETTVTLDLAQDTTKNNELTKSSEDAVPNSEPSAMNVNFETLRENNGFVLRLLSLDPLDKESSKENTLLLVDKIRMLDELEEMYVALENLQKSFAKTSSTESSTNIAPKDPNDSRYSSLELLREKLITKRGSKKFHDTPRKLFIRNKLKELHSKNHVSVSSYFPEENKERVLSVLSELKHLYELILAGGNLESSSESSESFILHDFEEKGMTAYRERKRKRRKKGDPESLQNHLVTALKLHANPIFLMICLCRGVFMLTFIPLVTVVVDFAMDRGLEKSDGKFMIATLSLGDFLGRLCLGWVTDCGCLSLPRYMFVVMIILGGSTAALPFTYSKGTLLPGVLLFGILNGSLFVRHPLLVSKYMKSHEQTIAMGFINFLAGFIGFALPAFIGYFRDTLGSYDQMFYLNGVICAAVGFMWILEPLFVRFTPPENSPYDRFIYPRK